MNRCFAVRNLFSLVGLLLAAQGCTQRAVNFTSDPTGASLQIQRLKNGSPTNDPVVTATTPTRQTLDFPDGVSYRVTATLPQFLNATAEVAKPPSDNTTVQLALTRYLSSVPTIRFVPKFAEREAVWTLAPEYASEEGYIREIDYMKEDPGTIVGLHRITGYDQGTQQREGTIDVRNCVMSPNADLLIYDKITERVLDESIHVTPKDKDKAQTLTAVAIAEAEPLDQVYRDNPGLPKSGDLPPESHVVIRHRELSSVVVRKSLQGQSQADITPHRVAAVTPDFTFGGESILFSSDNATLNPVLWRMDVEGGGTKMTRVTNSAENLEYQPSGGREFVAYTAYPRRAVAPQIWTVHPDASENASIGEGECPQANPRQGLIMFLRGTPDRSGHRTIHQVWTMRANGEAVGPLTHNTDYDIMDARWSPDGNYIVYASDQAADPRGVHNYDIWIMAADGSRAVQLTRNGSYDSSPSFDSAQKSIYFRSNRGGYWNVWQFELGPQAKKQLGM